MLLDTYKAHYPSRGNCIISSPCKFIARYALGIRGGTSAAMDRGSACDYGVGTALMQGGTVEDAVSLALQYYDTINLGEVTKERGKIDGIVRQFWKAFTCPS